MNPNEQLIEEFFAAFAAHNVKTMSSCYHQYIQFQDPVFGVLKGKDVTDMWHMLIDRSNGHLKIEFSNVSANNDIGSANWVATYIFSKTNRPVVNEVHSSFEFKDGLIIRQIDTFDMWKWSRQAFGTSGFLLGWTGFMHRKISSEARLSLRKYQEKELAL